jgi:hypothetical protein
MPGRTARQCRERWSSYLSPDIRVGRWTEEEDSDLLTCISQYGFKWATIAPHFNGRSSSDVKNRWHSHLKEISVQDENGQFWIPRDCFGAIVEQKKKRKRKIVSAFTAALDHARRSSTRPDYVRPFPHPPSAMLFGDHPLQLPPLLPRGLPRG